MAKVAVGNCTFTLQDVFSVAAHSAEVTPDLAVLEKLRGNTGGELVDSLPSPNIEGQALTKLETRAVLIAKLASVMQTRSGCSAEVAESLVHSLNTGPLPTLYHGAIGTSLVQALFGQADSSQARLVDVQAMLQGTDSMTGLLSILAMATNEYVAVSDAAVALTVEALQASSRPFDSEISETLRPQKGQVASASSIRTLLEDSREVQTVAPVSKGKGKSKNKGGGQPDTDLLSAPQRELFGQSKTEQALTSSAQALGAARDALVASSRVLQIEVNAAGGAPLGVTQHPQPLLAAANDLHNALVTVVSGSVARCSLLSAGPSGNVAASEAGSTWGTVLDVQGALGELARRVSEISALVEAASNQLCEEIVLAEQILAKREAERAVAAARKEEAKQRAAAARGAKAPGGGAKDEFEGMSEEKKAIILAKRAAKEAKKAAKQANKEQSTGLNLGKGTVVFRKYAFARSPYTLEGVADTEGVADVPLDQLRDIAKQALDVWRRPSGDRASPSAFLTELLQHIGAGGAKRKPKIHRGTRDFLPEQMEVRQQVFTVIRDVFRRHGAVEIDTPVFELRDTLMGKYGEEGGKLIFDLADQGAEQLSLRYDLTVPFARFVAMNGVGNIKRFHIAKVYRRDQPVISRGRYREFYQCDYDVAGSYAPMLPEADVLKVACDILSNLPIGPFEIKLNHRIVLDAMMELAGVPAAKFRAICSAIDKLDKAPWSEVKEEMVMEKGLPEKVADKIGEMVILAGKPFELHDVLVQHALFKRHKGAVAALAELKLLFQYLEAMGALQYIKFDLSLARGLDYYTGVIYEAVLTSPNAVGSIAAGGRYDNLVGMFSQTSTQVPCVGVSIGVERVFAILERNAAEAGGLKKTPVQVLVAAVGKDMTIPRLQVCAELWKAGFSAEVMYSTNPKLVKQLNHANDTGIPFVVVLGEDELKEGKVNVKKLANRQQETVAREKLADTLLEMGAVRENEARGGGGGGGGADSMQALLEAAEAKAAAANPAGPSTEGPATVGTVVEGLDRRAGRFSRPAKPIVRK